jgi:DNA-binding NarL/FixJ family response regulator
MLPLVAEGKTNREIAEALLLSEFTVKTYISDILRKMQVTRRSQLAAFPRTST